jgi:ATP-binding cassette subfamily B protein
MVTQSVQLFRGTVRDNLTFFDSSVPDDHVLGVIDRMGLTDWFQTLSNGLDTELESGGGGISAGEAQLLTFTRVFLKDPGLVILDEASSRLDPVTESQIEKAVEYLLKDRTGIIIAHRLSTVQRADDILILDDGRIVEHGARAALADDPDSRYSNLLKTGMTEVLS